MLCVIGITCDWGEDLRHKAHDEYVQAVSKAGGIPFLIPTVEPSLSREIYERLDGIIFSGGDDVDPSHFGEEPQVHLGRITPERDAFELALARLALEGPKPVLAICRGLQVVNIAAGGDVYQDLAGITTQLHRQQAPRWYGTHRVRLDRKSRLFSLLQKESFRVNSFHHQGVRRVGAGLKAVGWTEDGLVEAVESREEDKMIIGVQWHPECSWNKDPLAESLFLHLIQEAQRRKE